MTMCQREAESVVISSCAGALRACTLGLFPKTPCPELFSLPPDHHLQSDLTLVGSIHIALNLLRPSHLPIVYHAPRALSAARRLMSSSPSKRTNKPRTMKKDAQTMAYPATQEFSSQAGALPRINLARARVPSDSNCVPAQLFAMRIRF